MTIEAGITVVLIAVFAAVFVVHLGLVVLMTEDALEDGKVRGVDVTIGTLIPFLAVFAGIDREILRVVIPVGRCPGRRSVAGLTLGREVCRRVIGVGCVVVRELMTGKAKRRRAGICGGMASEALEGQVRAGQSKSGRAMIEE